MTETFTPPTRFAVPGRIAVSNRAASVWQTATITEIRRETPYAATFRLAVPAWEGHLPGQHLMLRLRAADGYLAQRHYSIASAPDGSGHVELTLDHVDGGEVSGWFHTVAEPGDQVEVRGPLSGFFAWPGDRPALLIGSRLRGRTADVHGAPPPGPAPRGPAAPAGVRARPRGTDLRGRVRRGDDARVHADRAAGHPVGRLTAAHLAPLLAERPDGGWEAYVCGSNGFAEHASRLLVAAGQPVDRIRIERFG